MSFGAPGEHMVPERNSDKWVNSSMQYGVVEIPTQEVQETYVDIPEVQVVEKVVEVPQLQCSGKVADAPAGKQLQAPLSQTSPGSQAASPSML